MSDNESHPDPTDDGSTESDAAHPNEFIEGICSLQSPQMTSTDATTPVDDESPANDDETTIYETVSAAKTEAHYTVDEWVFSNARVWQLAAVALHVGAYWMTVTYDPALALAVGLGQMAIFFYVFAHDVANQKTARERAEAREERQQRYEERQRRHEERMAAYDTDATTGGEN